MRIKESEAESSAASSSDSVVEPLRHFPDRSIRHLFENQSHTRALLELMIPGLASLMDFQRLVRVNRDFLPETLREQEADLVFSVPFRTDSGDREVLIHILIEHQSTVDDLMEYRLLSYMTLIWAGYRRDWDLKKTPKAEQRFPPILPIVFYTGETKWRTPLDFRRLLDLPEALERFVPRFDMLLLDVKDTDTEALTHLNAPLGWLLTVLQKENAETHEIRDALRTAIEKLQTLQDTHSAHFREALVYFLQLILHRRSPAEHQDLIHLVEQHSQHPEVKQMAQSMAEHILEQGIEQGARRTSIENTLAILNTRFPDADVETLTPTLEAIADIQHLKQLTLEASFVESFRVFQERLDT